MFRAHARLGPGFSPGASAFGFAEIESGLLRSKGSGRHHTSGGRIRRTPAQVLTNALVELVRKVTAIVSSTGRNCQDDSRLIAGSELGCPVCMRRFVMSDSKISEI
jgi:hypothetical protein